MTEDATEKPRLEIDWGRTVAAALAAVTSAVLLSTLGAVGTLIGAAVGSVAATVGTAIYAQGLARSRRAVALAQETALGRIGAAQAEVRRAQRRGTDTQAHLDHAGDELAEAQAELEEVAEDPAATEERPGWRERLADLPWKRIAMLTAAIFVAVLLAITVFEQVTGRSVSSYTGGSDDRRTTIFGGEEDDADQRRDREDRSPEPTEPDSEAPVETEDPTEEPTLPPTAEPSDDDTTPPVPTPTDQSPTSTLPVPSPTG
jgi:uncharacterized membrane protein